MIDWKEVMRRSVKGNPAPPRRVERTPEEWKASLTEEQFYVARLSGTERPFSSELCTLFGPGLYHCICCDTLLFDASEKFDSGTGWPSFTQAADDTVVAYKGDHSVGMSRIEATCAVCDAHLGHVFPDGPPPTGLRYCMNAVVLRKAAEEG